MKIAELAVALGIIGSTISGLMFLDGRHAKMEAQYELQGEILDVDIKKDAELISHYERKQLEVELTEAEQARFKYIEKELQRKIDKKNLIEKRLLDF